MRFRIGAALLLLCVCAVPRAQAQSIADYDYEHLTFRGLGFTYGYIWPTKVEPTSSYTARFDLGYLGPAVRIMPSVSYWSSSIRRSELQRFADQLNRLPALSARGVTISPTELGDIAWSDLSIALDGHAVWTTRFVRAFPYLGAGLSLHALNGQGSAVQETFVEDLLDSTTAGLAVMGGIEFEPITSFRIVGEARLNLLNDIRYPELRIGGALMLARGNRSPSERTQ